MMIQSGKKVIRLAVMFLVTLSITFPTPNSFASEKTVFNAILFPTPPREHPRLYLRHSDLEELRQKITHPAVKPIWEKTIAALKYTNHAKNFEQERSAFEAHALIYLIENNQASGKLAVQMALSYFERVTFPPKKDVTRDIGRALTGGAIVYDWCYPLLTTQEKQQFIGHFIRLAKTMEIGYPPVKQGAVTGHAGEAQLFRDLLSIGIAVYDEEPTIYNLTAARFFKEMVPARNFFYPSHLHNQGDSYGMYRYRWELFSAWIYQRMGYPNIFNVDQGKLPYYWIYTRRPDGQLLRNGDSSKANQASTYWSEPMAFLLATSYYKDPYLMDEFRRQYTKPSSDSLFELLLIDPELAAKPVSELPLTRYFGYPMGTMVARTGWDTGSNSNTVVAEMKVGVFQFNNHQHLDSGQFQLYYRGGLAIDSGIYQGDYEYGSSHDVNYYKRTIAHNCLLVYDPAEQFSFGSRTGLINDGGQRFPNGGKEAKNLDELLNGDYRVGSVLAHYIGPDPHQPEISYLKGDLTQAYTSKVQNYQRSFLFWNLKSSNHPAALIVLDRVTVSDSSFKRTWLLHSLEEPRIQGSTTTICRTEKGYHGQLITTTLLPEANDLSITKTGGPGREFWVNGTNFPNHPDPRSTTDESGAWRIEIAPKHEGQTTLFLNVLQVQDAGLKDGLPVSKLECGEAIGVKVGSRVAFFNKHGELFKKTFTFTIPGKEILNQVVITDLDQGKWELRKEHKILAVFEVNEEKPVVIFNGGTGEYEMRLTPPGI